jgi:hypothetical protein
MNQLKVVLFVTVLVLIGATADVLAHAKASQRIGRPGVTTEPLPESRNLKVILPTDLTGYKSESRLQAEMVTNMLPKDTSFGQRLYTGDDGFQALANVVLMGTSRSSIHDPQVCLTAQGWKINDALSRVQQVHLDKPFPYDLPVMRILASRDVEIDGRQVTERAIYVYWFVDGDRYTATRLQWNLWSARDMVLRDTLDRWAYISFFTVCLPGQEDATLERLKKLIAVSVPEFQLVPLAGK